MISTSDFILPILQPNTGCFPIQKSLYFSNFGDFYQPEDFFWIYSQILKAQACIPKKGNKITAYQNLMNLLIYLIELVLQMPGFRWWLIMSSSRYDMTYPISFIPMYSIWHSLFCCLTIYAPICHFSVLICPTVDKLHAGL